MYYSLGWYSSLIEDGYLVMNNEIRGVDKWLVVSGKTLFAFTINYLPSTIN